MLTKNFKQVMKLVGVATTNNSDSLGILPVTNYANTVRYARPVMQSTFPLGYYFSNIPNAAGAGVVFGSGTTPATENDYNVESAILSGLSVPTPTVTYSYDNEKVARKLTYAVTNTSSSSITISEIGWRVKLNCTTSQGSGSTIEETVLMDRTVLDTPVTIPAGETRIIEYSIISTL